MDASKSSSGDGRVNPSPGTVTLRIHALFAVLAQINKTTYLVIVFFFIILFGGNHNGGFGILKFLVNHSFLLVSPPSDFPLNSLLLPDFQCFGSVLPYS